MHNIVGPYTQPPISFWKQLLLPPFPFCCIEYICTLIMPTNQPETNSSKDSLTTRSFGGSGRGKFCEKPLD